MLGASDNPRAACDWCRKYRIPLGAGAESLPLSEPLKILPAKQLAN